MNFKHWIAIVVVIFVCIYVFNAGTLKNLPIVGGYVSS